MLSEKSIKKPQTRRTFLQAAVLTTGGTLLAACGEAATQLKEVPTIPAQEPTSVAATVTASVGKTYFPSGDPNIPDAFTAPLPSFQSVRYVPGSGNGVDVFSLTFNALPVARDKNRFWKELEKRLNVKWNLTLASGPDVYREKVGTLLASGKLPDLFFIDSGAAPALNGALQQGAFHDLTPHLTGNELKNYPNLARISPQIWENAKINGKLFGIPRPRILISSVLVYRKDWAQKVGITNPKNADEFFELLKAFREGDPTGKKTNTWPLGFATTGITSLPFFMDMFRVPNAWRIEKDGKLTHFTATEEYKQAIDYVRKVFAAGLFHPDSASLTNIQLQRNFIGETTGMYHAGLNGLPILRRMFREAKIETDTNVLIPFGADGGKWGHRSSTGVFGVTGIPSSIGDPERIKELLRIMDYLAAPTFSTESNFLLYGLDKVHSEEADGIRTLNQTGSTEILDITNVANGPFTYYYPSDREIGPAMLDITRKMLKDTVPNPVVNIFSPAASKHSGVLGQFLDDRILRIVRGIDPLSTLDSINAEWKSRGGAEIIKEISEQLDKS